MFPLSHYSDTVGRDSDINVPCNLQKVGPLIISESQPRAAAPAAGLERGECVHCSAFGVVLFLGGSQRRFGLPLPGNGAELLNLASAPVRVDGASILLHAVSVITFIRPDVVGWKPLRKLRGFCFGGLRGHVLGGYLTPRTTHGQESCRKRS